MATLGGVTREETHRFKLNKRVENMDLVLTVSQKNKNQLTVTKGIAYRRNYFIYLTSYTSTVLAPVTEMRIYHHLPKV